MIRLLSSVTLVSGLQHHNLGNHKQTSLISKDTQVQRKKTKSHFYERHGVKPEPETVNLVGAQGGVDTKAEQETEAERQSFNSEMQRLHEAEKREEDEVKRLLTEEKEELERSVLWEKSQLAAGKTVDGGVQPTLRKDFSSSSSFVQTSLSSASGLDRADDQLLHQVESQDREMQQQVESLVTGPNGRNPVDSYDFPQHGHSNVYASTDTHTVTPLGHRRPQEAPIFNGHDKNSISSLSADFSRELKELEVLSKEERRLNSEEKMLNNEEKRLEEEPHRSTKRISPSSSIMMLQKEGVDSEGSSEELKSMLNDFDRLKQETESFEEEKPKQHSLLQTDSQLDSEETSFVTESEASRLARLLPYPFEPSSLKHVSLTETDRKILLREADKKAETEEKGEHHKKTIEEIHTKHSASADAIARAEAKKKAALARFEAQTKPMWQSLLSELKSVEREKKAAEKESKDERFMDKSATATGLLESERKETLDSEYYPAPQNYPQPGMQNTAPQMPMPSMMAPPPMVPQAIAAQTPPPQQQQVQPVMQPQQMMAPVQQPQMQQQVIPQQPQMAPQPQTQPVQMQQQQQQMPVQQQPQQIQQLDMSGQAIQQEEQEPQQVAHQQPHPTMMTQKKKKKSSHQGKKKHKKQVYVLVNSTQDSETQQVTFLPMKKSKKNKHPHATKHHHHDHLATNQHQMPMEPHHHAQVQPVMPVQAQQQQVQMIPVQQAVPQQQQQMVPMQVQQPVMQQQMVPMQTQQIPQQGQQQMMPMQQQMPQQQMMQPVQMQQQMPIQAQQQQRQQLSLAQYNKKHKRRGLEDDEETGSGGFKNEMADEDQEYQQYKSEDKQHAIERSEEGEEEASKSDDTEQEASDSKGESSVMSLSQHLKSTFTDADEFKLWHTQEADGI